jgi:hypothetical protein
VSVRGRFDAGTFLTRYDRLDAALVAAGFPPTSPWWRGQLERFFRSGRRQFVLRVGRRGGKSSTLCRVAVAWALWGSHAVPPGDIGVVAFVSVSRDESAQRLRTIEAVLKVLEVAYRRSGDAIELEDARAAFKTFTASVAGVSGPTCIMVLGDELAKWKDADTGSNPASEVIASLKPTVATQPNAPLFWSSSAFSKDDFHAAMFDRGETSDQLVAHAATWEANPSVSEESTHELEPDAATWQREYGAIPSDSAIENWFGAAIDLAIDANPPPPLVTGLRSVIAIDAAFVRDCFGWAVVSSRVAEREANGRARRITYTMAADAWKPGKPSETIARLKAEVCCKYELPPREVSHVFADQHEGTSFGELARLAGVLLEIVPWTGGSGETSKLARFKAVRLAMLEGTFRIPNDSALIKEFRSVRGVLTPAGNERIEVPRTSQGHGDRVSALCLAGSIALGRAANEPEPPPTVHDDLREHKQRLIRESEARRRREWERNPSAALRRALGREA